MFLPIRSRWEYLLCIPTYLIYEKLFSISFVVGNIQKMKQMRTWWIARFILRHKSRISCKSTIFYTFNFNLFDVIDFRVTVELCVENSSHFSWRGTLIWKIHALTLFLVVHSLCALAFLSTFIFSPGVYFYLQFKWLMEWWK